MSYVTNQIYNNLHQLACSIGIGLHLIGLRWITIDPSNPKIYAILTSHFEIQTSNQYLETNWY